MIPQSNLVPDQCKGLTHFDVEWLTAFCSEFNCKYWATSVRISSMANKQQPQLTVLPGRRPGRNLGLSILFVIIASIVLTALIHAKQETNLLRLAKPSLKSDQWLSVDPVYQWVAGDGIMFYGTVEEIKGSTSDGGCYFSVAKPRFLIAKPSDNSVSDLGVVNHALGEFRVSTLGIWEVSPDGRWFLGNTGDFGSGEWNWIAIGLKETKHCLFPRPPQLNPSMLKWHTWYPDSSGWIAVYAVDGALHAVSYSLDRPNHKEDLVLGQTDRIFDHYPGYRFALIGCSPKQFLILAGLPESAGPARIVKFKLQSSHISICQIISVS